MIKKPKSKPQTGGTRRARNPDGSANAVDVHVGNRIRQARTLRGFTQQQLGNKIGIAFQQVQKYERGHNRVSAGRLFEFGKVLGVPPGWFFEGMKDAVAASSPASLNLGQMPTIAEPEYKRDGLILARHYARIENQGARQSLHNLVLGLAALGQDGAQAAE